MESKLLDPIISHFKQQAGFSVTCLSHEITEKHNKFDGKLLFTKSKEDLSIQLMYQSKKSILPANVISLKSQLNQIDLNTTKVNGTIVFAFYISTKARNLLKDANINYADTAGNIYLNEGGIFIFIETNKSNRKEFTYQKNRAFSKTGLKVMFQLLRSENRVDIDKIDINATYQKIADKANVSKDTVSKVFKDLLSQKLIYKNNNSSNSKYSEPDKNKLVTLWVDAYNSNLRHKLKQRRYRWKKDEPNIFNNVPGYQPGGLVAASRHLDLESKRQQLEFIDPSRIIYTHKGFDTVVNDLEVLPDINGNITVYEAFWEDDSGASPNHSYSCADYLVTYADLLSYEDPRYNDVALKLYNTCIHDKL